MSVIRAAAAAGDLAQSTVALEDRFCSVLRSRSKTGCHVSTNSAAILARHSPEEIHRPAALRAAQNAAATSTAASLGAQTWNSPRAHTCVSSSFVSSRRSVMQGISAARAIHSLMDFSSLPGNEPRLLVGDLPGAHGRAQRRHLVQVAL